jgi:hypothetical protein
MLKFRLEILTAHLFLLRLAKSFMKCKDLKNPEMKWRRRSCQILQDCLASIYAKISL